MPNLPQINRKIKSVRVTSRITHALEIVATTQSHVYRDIRNNTLPYFQGIHRLFFEVFNNPEHDIRETNKSLFAFAPGKKELWIVIGSDIGMCGDMNDRIRRYILNSFDKNGDGLVIFGNRLINFLTPYLSEYILDSDKSELTMKDAIKIIRDRSKKIFDLFMQGNYQKLTLVHIKNHKEGIIEKIKILPFTENYFPTKKGVYVMNFESKLKYPEVVIDMFPQYLECIFLGALISSKVGEHDIRRELMHSATKNAKELLDEYTLTFNKLRQANITQEINEIVVASQMKSKK